MTIYGSYQYASASLYVGFDLETGDFNGDGRVDIVSAGAHALTGTDTPIFVFLQDANGFFSRLETTSTVINATDIEVGDFNLDGKDDIFVGDSGIDFAPYSGATNVLLYSNSAGTLDDVSGNLPQLAAFTHEISQGDIDNDGDKDVYVGNVYGGVQPGTYFLKNTSGSFTMTTSNIPSEVAGGGAWLDIFTASELIDLDNDGDLDMVLGAGGPDFQNRALAGGEATNNLILKNDGAGNFSEFQQYENQILANNPVAVDVEGIDLNGDGRQDILTAYASYSTGNYYIQVMEQQANGSFVDMSDAYLAGQSHPTGWFHDVDVVDFNNDGYDDFLTHDSGVNADSSTPVLYLNAQGGGFHRIELTGSAGQTHTVSDIDGNGYADLVALVKDTTNSQLQISITHDIGRSATTNLTDGNDVFTTTSIYAQEVYGKGGDDLITGSGSSGDVIYGNIGNDTISSGAGNDTVFGGQNNDSIFGDDGNDVLYGNLANDEIVSGNGSDVLYGGQGDDVLYANNGSDTLFGNLGSDTLYGGSDFNQDVFVMSAGDDIAADFEVGIDKIGTSGDFTGIVQTVSGSDLLITNAAGQTITLIGVSSNLSQGEFVFL